MATKYLSASANWSAAVWWTTSGGSTTTTAPGVGDDANLNSNTLTVDQTFTCDRIVGAGQLGISSTRTINADLGESGGTSTWTCSVSAAATVTINGNVYGGSSGSSRLVVNGASTIINITGNVSGNTVRAINVVSGTLNVTGNVSTTGGNGITAPGGTTTINGSVTGGNANSSAGYGVSVTGGTVNINGTVTGGTGTSSTVTSTNYGACVTSGTLTIVGSLVDGSSASAVVKSGGTFNYTPTNVQTATIGGKTMYPTAGGINRTGMNGGLVGAA